MRFLPGSGVSSAAALFSRTMGSHGLAQLGQEASKVGSEKQSLLAELDRIQLAALDDSVQRGPADAKDLERLVHRVGRLAHAERKGIGQVSPGHNHRSMICDGSPLIPRRENDQVYVRRYLSEFLSFDSEKLRLSAKTAFRAWWAV